MKQLKTWQTLIILLIVVVVGATMFSLAINGPVEAESLDARAEVFVEHVQVDTGADVAFTDSCSTTLVLTDPDDGILDNGLSGFALDVDTLTSGTTIDSMITIPSEYALNSIDPIVRVRISGVDLADNIAKGAASAELFTISPCITQAVVVNLDDDDGNQIIPPGTILFP